MVYTVQRHKLLEKAIRANIPHGVEVEGTVVGVELLLPTLKTCFVQWIHRVISHMRKQPVAPPDTEPQTVKFCNIRRIDFSNLPPGDGKKLSDSAPLRVNNLDYVVQETLGRGGLFAQRRPFNVRARFYANGALTVNFLSLTH